MSKLPKIGAVGDAIFRETALYRKTRLGQLVISAGMMRSGSTLLFNILRLGLEADPHKRVSSCWIGDIGSTGNADTYLVKMHSVSRAARWRASHIFYSFRDIRDALVSYSRRFGDPTIDLARSWIREYEAASSYATRTFSYKELTQDLEATVSTIVADLKLDVDESKIVTALREMESPAGSGERYSAQSLMHRDHRTNTVAGEWQEILSPDLLRNIEEEFAWWFAENRDRLSDEHGPV